MKNEAKCIVRGAQVRILVLVVLSVGPDVSRKTCGITLYHRRIRCGVPRMNGPSTEKSGSLIAM